MRWIILAALLATGAPRWAHVQTSNVQKFQIQISNPVYTGMPIWIQAALSLPLEVRYPYGEDPGNFGPNRLEVKRENHVLAQIPYKSWGSVSVGPVDGSIAPATSPKNRLPLHLQYALDKPGTYSVRWTVVRHNFQDGKMAELVVAQSDWVDFEVRRSTPEQRKNWFEKQRAKIPSGAGELVGDSLPSLLADAPDPPGLHVVLEQLYSTEPLIRSCALGSLPIFWAEDIRSQVLDMLRLRGPNKGLAYVISWRAPWFQDHEGDLVRTILPYLHSHEDWQIASTLKMLGFLVHPGTFHWPPDSQIPIQSDHAVLAAAPKLMGKSPGVSQSLAEYLGGIKNPSARFAVASGRPSRVSPRAGPYRADVDWGRAGLSAVI
jgi:hypothetical protein